MKGAIIYNINTDDPRNLGVVTKMLGQQKALQLANIEVDAITIRNNRLVIYRQQNRVIQEDTGKGLLSFRHIHFFNKLGRLLSTKDYRFLYVRFSIVTPFFIQFLKNVKRKNPQCILILEFPTYPFAKEYQGFFLKSIYRLSDVMASKYLPNLLDRIVVYGEQNKIYQIPTIQIRNGVDLSNYSQVRKTKRGRKVRLIATGRWAYWHGLDRILRGLGKYCQSTEAPNIEMTIIGDGPELQNLIGLSRNLSLQSVVKFTGPLKADELDSYFDEADIAVGSLGAHRKDLDSVSSLKHREYAARGIPFILSDWDPDFPENLSWIRYFPRDESPIDIERIINFFYSISDGDTTTHYDIRNYAETNLTWSEKLKPVINYLWKT